MPVINRVGNPTVSRGDVAEMNISMPVRHGMLVARLSALADELERLARSKVLIRIAADLDPDGRSASQLRNPARVGPHTLLFEQGQRVGPATLLAGLLRLVARSNKKCVDRRQCDRGPSQEGAGETVYVPGCHWASLAAGNQGRDKSDDERNPDWPELRQPLDECCGVHVAASRSHRATMLAGDERRSDLTAGDPVTGAAPTGGSASPRFGIAGQPIAHCGPAPELQNCRAGERFQAIG